VRGLFLGSHGLLRDEDKLQRTAGAGQGEKQRDSRMDSRQVETAFGPEAEIRVGPAANQNRGSLAHWAETMFRGYWVVVKNRSGLFLSHDDFCRDLAAIELLVCNISFFAVPSYIYIGTRGGRVLALWLLNTE
jgi:hypothetical protein